MPTRKAWRMDGDKDRWQVTVYRRSEDNTRGIILRTEPTIYYSEAEALAASREDIDVYLKRFKGTREERLREIHRVAIAGSCNGPYRTTSGPVPFFKAIYAEQIEFGDDPRYLEILREMMKDAETNFAIARKAR
jgi:hypothetical protein